MQKPYFVLYLLIVLIPINMAAQVNYVQNPSFEQYSRCPYNLDQIKFAIGWQPIDTINHPPIDSFGSYFCTPEYCNTCAGNNSVVGVPSSQFFFHYPRTGNGMAQVLMFNDVPMSNPYQRDYLQGHLSKHLTAGQSYCVTFYATLDWHPEYAVNHLGAYLDNGSIDTTTSCGPPQTTHIPQIVENLVIFDSINWVKIEGSFIATGNEKFITIGNFSDSAHTTHIVSNTNNGGSSLAAYLIDDVSVVESDIQAYAGGTFFKAKMDSVFIGRNEIVPDCEWYRNGVLIDTVHAGFWVKDTVNTTYVVKQSICGNVKYDTAHIMIARLGVPSVGNESIFKIYPNPAQHEITIQGVNNRSTATLAIYDFSGRVMLQQEVSFVNGEVRMPLSLAGGMYVVELVDKDGGKNIQRLSIL